MATRTDAGHTPKRSVSRSMDTDDTKSPRFRSISIGAVDEEYDDEYLNEDDFEAFDESVGSKSLDNVLPQSPIVLPAADDADDDGLDDALLDDESDEAAGGKEQHDEEEEGNDVEGMTLESYMQEYAKKAAVKNLDDDLVTGDILEASPEAVDPQV